MSTMSTGGVVSSTCTLTGTSMRVAATASVKSDAHFTGTRTVGTAAWVFTGCGFTVALGCAVGADVLCTAGAHALTARRIAAAGAMPTKREKRFMPEFYERPMRRLNR